jgi:hypothetical protein
MDDTARKMPDDSTLASYASLEEAIHSASAEVLRAAAADPALNEDLALALLKRSDLPPEVLERISKNAVVKSRKAKLAVVAHPKTPRYVSVTLLRQLFTFDLMKVALTPVIPGDIKAAAEEALVKRLESLSLGERISLARRASGRVAGALLLDPETRVIRAALENPRLTEALVIRALMSAGSSAGLVRMACEHAKWSLRREIRVALLRNEKTLPRFAEQFAKALPVARLKEILQSSRLPEAVKSRLLKQD